MRLYLLVWFAIWSGKLGLINGGVIQTSQRSTHSNGNRYNPHITGNSQLSVGLGASCGVSSLSNRHSNDLGPTCTSGLICVPPVIPGFFGVCAPPGMRFAPEDAACGGEHIGRIGCLPGLGCEPSGPNSSAGICRRESPPLFPSLGPAPVPPQPPPPPPPVQPPESLDSLEWPLESPLELPLEAPLLPLVSPDPDEDCFEPVKIPPTPYKNPSSPPKTADVLMDVQMAICVFKVAAS
ncbi:hypothetical protein BDF19DRAFT_416988 [Syncephalis fuscata]|nr:hypothetical protein BDF19DRAFT_416988 [Syncephalis fuscata]